MEPGVRVRLGLAVNKPLVEAFATFDIDGSGTLTADECVAILMRQGGGAPMSLEDARAYVARFDRDGNNVLDYAEFAAAMVHETEGAEDALLRVHINGNLVAEIPKDAELPLAKDASAVLTEHPVVTFTKSDGTTVVHDMTSFAAPDGVEYLHLNIRLPHSRASGIFNVQVDGVLSDDGDSDAAYAQFNTGECQGVRFAPFNLPESTKPPRPAGLNLHERGLHYPGTTTPTSVSLSCVCDHCGKSFRLKSYRCAYNRGSISFVYCAAGTHALLFNKVIAGSTNEGASRIEGRGREPETVVTFEAGLPPCAHSGKAFAYKHSFRCPHCSEPYLDYENPPCKGARGRGRAEDPFDDDIDDYWCELHCGPRAQILKAGEGTWEDEGWQYRAESWEIEPETAWMVGYGAMSFQKL